LKWWSLVGPVVISRTLKLHQRPRSASVARGGKPAWFGQMVDGGRLQHTVVNNPQWFDTGRGRAQADDRSPGRPGVCGRTNRVLDRLPGTSLNIGDHHQARDKPSGVWHCRLWIVHNS